MTVDAPTASPTTPAASPDARVAPRSARRGLPLAGLGVVVAIYATAFGSAAAARHLAFDTARFDLGNMVQAIWSTANGRFLEATDASGHDVSRLGGHVDPFLALLTPLWSVWPDPVVLLVLQALAVSLGAFPVFWLARRRLADERSAFLFALAYLLFPATQWNAFTPVSNFHPVSFALPLVLLAIWLLDQHRLLPFVVTAAVVASTKEHMPLAVGCLGLWYAIEHRRRIVGVAIFATGAAISALNFLVVIPAFSTSGDHRLVVSYEQFGSTPLGIVRGALTNPGELVATVVTSHKLLYLALLFLPFLGVWALAPLLLIGAVPELAVGLLSNNPNQTSIFFHYSAGIAPFVVAATIFGASRLKWGRRRVPVYILAGVGAIAAVTPLYLGAQSAKELFLEQPEIDARRAAVSLIPPHAAVSTTNALGAHLSARRTVLLFPDVRRAEWVAVDTADDSYLGRGRPGRTAFERLRRDQRFALVYAREGVLVFRRSGG